MTEVRTNLISYALAKHVGCSMTKVEEFEFNSKVDLQPLVVFGYTKLWMQLPGRNFRDVTFKVKPS